ncbi:MAG: M23 family metallopeptidase [Methylacidiphilales bacterium]|nr:M23 family metallopeptidase [Candidatus Methylacidiphilales bacterium]
MNIVISFSLFGRPRAIAIGGRRFHVVALIASLLLLVLGGGIGYSVSQYFSPYSHLIELWTNELNQQKEILQQLTWETDTRVESLATELGRLHYEVSKLDSITVKLSTAALLDVKAFIKEKELNYPKDIMRFSLANNSKIKYQIIDLDQLYQTVEKRIDAKSQELYFLYSLLQQRKVTNATIPTGYPIKNGYITSYYGMRLHPLSGQFEFHSGVDIGSTEIDGEVFATASGIVTSVGYQGGYGNLIEIDHGNGLRTRYAHNQKIYVPNGTVVYRGQPIAKLGSTGDSTGPHVHYEIVKDNQSINPLNYILR